MLIDILARQVDDGLLALPDYYIALLHKRLMGTQVLQVSSDRDSLRVYAHCTADGAEQGTALAFVNVDVQPAVLQLQSEAGGTLQGEGEQWVLTPDESGLVDGAMNMLQTRAMSLNGQVLASDDLALDGLAIPGDQITVPARSFGFVRLDWVAPACLL